MSQLKAVIFILNLFFISSNLEGQAQNTRINGLTVVGVPAPYKTNPIPRLNETLANWICLVPYGFGQKEQTNIRFNVSRQWWGEKEEGIVETVKLAREKNLKILLKPQIYIHGSWPGDIDFDNEKDWLEWEKNYKEFIFFYLRIAAREEIEMFCIGTEFKKSVLKRKSFWVDLISEARTIYCGEITYSSNWDNYQSIGFWKELDYIGISAYFPILNKDNPSVEQIKKAWMPKVKSLKTFSRKWDRKILFTEYGYLAVDRTTYNNWELEKQIKQLKVNEQAQANALQALYESFYPQKYWAGGFLWKWFPNNHGHEGYIEKDYTPQDKLGEAVLKKFFGPQTSND